MIQNQWTKREVEEMEALVDLYQEKIIPVSEYRETDAGKRHSASGCSYRVHVIRKRRGINVDNSAKRPPNKYSWTREELKSLVDLHESHEVGKISDEMYKNTIAGKVHTVNACRVVMWRKRKEGKMGSVPSEPSTPPPYPVAPESVFNVFLSAVEKQFNLHLAKLVWEKTREGLLEACKNCHPKQVLLENENKELREIALQDKAIRNANEQLLKANNTLIHENTEMKELLRKTRKIREVVEEFQGEFMGVSL